MDFPAYNPTPPPQQPNTYYQPPPPPPPNTGYGYEFNQINYSGPPPQGNYNSYQQPQYDQQYHQQNQQYGHNQYHQRQQYNNRPNNRNSNNNQRHRQQQHNGQVFTEFFNHYLVCMILLKGGSLVVLFIFLIFQVENFFWNDLL